GGARRLADAVRRQPLQRHRLVRVAPGSFVFQLVDAGITAGASCALLQFDPIEGFSAADFSFVGLAGSIAIGNGSLGFTAAVPEPAAALLFAAGLLCLVRVRKSVVGAAATRSRA
ncbi:MAG: PEP-CTERM sorting domain-containing protein, partial [Rubrivivax sp.]